MWGIVAASSVFLWMLPLAVLPILFHLFMRVRKQVRPFPSLMFFLQAEPRLSARKRIREWLALLLRILLIASLLLALSRLLWQGHSGGGAVSQVLLIDNSGSMGGEAPDGRTKLANALDAASCLMGDMGKSDSLAIVLLVEDSAASLPEGLSSDKELLRASLERIKVTHGSGTPGRALAQAFALLGAASTTRREVHIFTDAQETEWARPPSESRMPPGGTSITLDRIRSRPFESANVSVGEIEMPHRTLVADRHYVATVTLHNASKKEIRTRLNTTDSGGKKSSQPAEIPPHSRRTLAVPFETHAAGPNWLAVDLENDVFEPDNHSAVAFVCAPRRKVVFCGPETAFGMVPLAVSPSGDGIMSGLIPVFKRSEVALGELLRDNPAMVVVRESSAVFSTSSLLALKSYLEQGGNVLVLPVLGAQSAPASMPAWIHAKYGTPVTLEKGWSAMVLNKQAPVWDDLRDDAGEVMLAQTKVFKAVPLEVAAGCIPLLALQDGTPIVAQQTVGKGTLFVCGLDLDATTSTLPLKAGFVAFIHGMALAGRDPEGNATTLVAGMRPPGLEGSRLPVHLRSVTGGVMEWQGLGRNIPALARAGVYTVESGDRTSYIAVRSAPDEGNESFIETENIPALTDLGYRVEDYKDRESLLRFVRRQRNGIELYLPLLLLALAATVVEGWLVNPASLRHPGKSAPGRVPSRPIRDRVFSRLWKGGR